MPTLTSDSLRTDRKRSGYFVSGAFMRFFVPALLSSFWIAVAGVMDSVFVGKGVGAEGLAAIGFGQPVYLFYNILSYGFSIGGSIHFAAKLAEGHEEEGNRIFHTVLRLLLGIYIVTVTLGIAFLPQLMSLLGADPADSLTRTYIRTQLIFVPIMFCQGPLYYFVNADNGPKLAATALSVSGIADTLFSYIFVVRMGLGVAGSVYSTVVGAVLMLSMSLWHIISKKGTLRLSWTKMDWSAVGNAARTGFATSAQYLFQFITMIVVNRMLAKLGGWEAVAAFDVVYNILLLCESITTGATVATEPMISSYRAERNLGNIRITLSLALIASGVISASFVTVLITCAPQLSSVFGMDSGIGLEYATMGIRAYALSVLPAALSAVFCGYYQAILQEWMSYLITFLRSFLFYLVALAFCSRGGMDTFWNVFLCAEIVTILTWVPVAALRGGLLQLSGIDVTNVKTAVIDRSSQEISKVVSEIQEFCEERGAGPKQTMYTGLTIEEVCCAITDHFKGHMDDIYIQVTVVVENGEETLFLRDNAYEFNPLGIDTDDIDIAGGEQTELMGVRIVQKKAKEFYYRRYSGFNTLVIRL